MAGLPRILIIGIGGTGFEALVQAKALFQQYDDKIPPHCRLLYLDTVAPKDHGDASLRDVEWAPIVLRDPIAMLNDPSNSYILEWFPTATPVQTVVHGAAQLRPLGRLALHAQPERIVSQLTNAIDALTDRARLREAGDGASIDQQGSIEIYILTSLCGGTGSGTFLDIAWLLREQLRDVPTVRFTGVLLLPGPFRGLPGTDMVGPNAYAALKELDYLASSRAGVEFTFGPSRNFVMNGSPFDLVYLVDSLGEQYDTTRNVSNLARQMAYLPFLMSTASIGQHVREVLRNLLPQLESKSMVHGKRATYASFGVASIELPRSRVLRARHEFEAELLTDLLADGASIMSVDDLGVQEALTRCTVDHLPEILEMLLLEVDFGNPREPIDKLEAIYSATLNQVEEYARSIAAPIVRELRESASAKLTGLVLDASTSPGRIPATARECSRLQKILKERWDALRSPKAASEHAEKERKRTWEVCREAFKSRRRSKREGAANEWKEVVNTVILPARLMSTLDAEAADVVGSLIDRAREAEQWCSKARGNLERIQQLFATQEVRQEPEPNPFTRYGDAGKIRPRPEARKFLARAEMKSLLEGPVSDIKAALSAFSDNEFEPAFLPGHECSASSVVVSDPDKYIPELRRFSAPLWSYSLDKIPTEDRRGIHHLEVLGVDRHRGEVGAIESQYPDITVVSTNWSERVVFMQIRAGIPLFALTCMDTLWLDYRRKEAESGRRICHVDQRWAGWPELLSHAFNPVALKAFTAGLVSSQIVRSGITMEYQGNPSNRVLGDTFAKAYETLKGNAELCTRISGEADKRNLDDAAQQELEKLWELLINDIVPMDERHLVEAILRCIEKTYKKSARWRVAAWT